MSQHQRLRSNRPQADEATTTTDRDDDEGGKATGQLLIDKSGTTTCLHAGSGPRYHSRPVVGSASCESQQQQQQQEKRSRVVVSHSPTAKSKQALRRTGKHSHPRRLAVCPMSPMLPRPMPPPAVPPPCLQYCICCVLSAEAHYFWVLHSALHSASSLRSIPQQPASQPCAKPHQRQPPTPTRPSDAPTRAQHGSAESLRCGLGPPMLLCFVSHAYRHTHTLFLSDATHTHTYN